MHVGQVGLEQPKVGGELVVKPLQEDILGSEPDQYIVRGFNCIRVATFEDGVNQFASLCSSLCALNFIQQCMKLTVQLHSGLVWFSLTLYLFFIVTLSACADPEWVEVTSSSLPLVYVTCMVRQCFHTSHKFFL